MTKIKTHHNRRSFLKISAASGGGMLIGFNWLTSCNPVDAVDQLPIPSEWFTINGYIKIGDTGLVTIYNPNPEIGQNVMTSMPMIVAEELDVNWDHVVVEQGMLDKDAFHNPQFAGGSLSIMLGWDALRMAGATGRRMLLEAAAQEWGVGLSDLTVKDGIISEVNGDRTMSYGDIASKAAEITVPEEVDLKDPKDFTLIGSAQKNVVGPEIVTGSPLFGLDFKREGMLLAMIEHAPSFGMKVVSFNEEEIKSMSGVKDAFIVDTSYDDEGRFDTNAFNQLITIIGDSTWSLMNAKKAIKAEWEVVSPLESDEGHSASLSRDLESGELQESRNDGNVEEAFSKASQIIERSYSSPIIAHNCMEPMNFFAHVTEDKAELIGPTQTPNAMQEGVSKMLGIPLENVSVQLTRMGGGFGRRLYTHFGLEAAAISKKAGVPIKLIYTREDDMTQGTYRPAYKAVFKAGLDENNDIVAFSVRGVGFREGPVFPNRFPAGAIENYYAEKRKSPSNITWGAWRAPRSHFIAGAEQSFLDEIAEITNQDPIDLRLQLLKNAKDNPVGEKYEYDADRYAGVLELVREKANWGAEMPGVYRGVAAYFCHNSYVAQVIDMVMVNDKPEVKKIWCAVDCGIVVNKEGAENIIQGGSVDGIGHAMYSGLEFENGAPKQKNFDTFQLIRMHQSPEEIEVHFVESDIKPTGLGEPGLPPVVGALANAMYQATGQRYYHQPFALKAQNQEESGKILKG